MCYCGDEAAWSLSLSPLARFLRSGDTPEREFEGATISGALFFAVDCNILFLYTLNIESGCCGIRQTTNKCELLVVIAHLARGCCRIS